MTITTGDIQAAAYLAAASYEETNSFLQARLSGSAWTALNNNDLLLSPSQFNGGGALYDVFNAQGFVAVSGNILAIVFRGTDDLSLPNGNGGITDWIGNASALIVGSFSDQARLFQDLVSAALSYVNAANANGSAADNISKILFVGHSLGGAIAEQYQYWNAASPLVNEILSLRLGRDTFLVMIPVF
jgi:hypothetical protein